MIGPPAEKHFTMTDLACPSSWEHGKSISRSDWDERGTFLSFFPMTSIQSRKAMSVISSGKEDEHPEMYIHYGYKVELNSRCEY